MKVIACSFQCESNSFTSILPQKEDFEFLENDEIFKKLCILDIFESNGIEVIPSIYANALPSGVVPRNIYEYYTEKIIKKVEDNYDIDGIFLYVHGSMEVAEIGSGELELLKRIRKIVSKNCIISVVMDLHANICEEVEEYANIICTYKTAPHTDQAETQKRAASALVKSLKSKKMPVTRIVKIPMLIKGDTMLTAKEPLVSLEKYTEELEKKEDVLAVSLFFGHCWVDAINTSASVSVSSYNKDIAISLSDELANKFYNTRFDYKFDIEALSAKDCVDKAISSNKNRVFITDSGDNTTAGAEGDKLEVLKLLLNKISNKKICVAGITDFNIVQKLYETKYGEKVFLENINKAGKFVCKGKILGWAKEIIGNCITVRVNNIDIIFCERRSAFIEKANFDKAGVNLTDYQIVVVKLGYLFTELKPYADYELFALTNGASCVEVEKLNLKNIIRPMFPIDNK